MIAAVAVALAFLTFSAFLAGDLRRQASRDPLGLKAARTAVLVEMDDRVVAERVEAQKARIQAAWADVFALVVATRQQEEDAA